MFLPHLEGVDTHLLGIFRWDLDVPLLPSSTSVLLMEFLMSHFFTLAPTSASDGIVEVPLT